MKLYRCSIIVGTHRVSAVLAESKDAAMCYALDSVYNAWTSCKYWGFEAQKRWAERIHNA